ncbi:MAG: hypothetical protein EBR94_08770, partial [Bacteroidetes bacterium]|nr:hypothetical protein [Bacteroidota bacterium]
MYRYIDRSKAFKKAEITIKQKNWQPSTKWDSPDSGLYWNTNDNTMYDSQTRTPVSDIGAITNADEANAFRDQWFEGSSTVDNQGNILQSGQVIPPSKKAEDIIAGNNFKNSELNENPLLNDPSFVNKNGVRSLTAVPFGNIVQWVKQNPNLLQPGLILPLNESEQDIFDQAKTFIINERAKQFSAQGARSADFARTAVPSATATAVP